MGKTNAAIAVARKLNTVIISADSRQCYKELKIGVARPSIAELETVKHYFIASHSIQQKIDAAYFENYTLALLKKLFLTHKTVVVTGGTGLYIKALTQGLDVIPEVPETIRQAIIKKYEVGGMEWLQQQLHIKDPLFVAQGEMQNPQRMMRALEVIETTGCSVISYRTYTKTKRDFGIIQIGLEMPRIQLNERINKRVGVMLAGGLEAEVKSLLPYRHLNALQTVGYKEMFEYIDGHLSLQQATEMIQQNTRRYAKRQMTWFKKQEEMQWIDIADFTDTKNIANLILEISI